MKITIEHDDGTEVVHQHISDYYMAIRVLEPKIDSENRVVIHSDTRSFSFGANLREITKEVGQSLVELQDYLRNFMRVQAAGVQEDPRIN